MQTSEGTLSVAAQVHKLSDTSVHIHAHTHTQSMSRCRSKMLVVYLVKRSDIFR